MDPSEVGQAIWIMLLFLLSISVKMPLYMKAHVRDFTSDPAISMKLTAQFVPLSLCRVSQLPQGIGCTDIQLLPVMS